MTPLPLPTLEISHRFETAHRLPLLGGKCVSLHGHSWRADITIGLTDHKAGWPVDGVVVDFVALKRGIREWIDDQLDHGTMLGASDTLLPVLSDAGKVFVFDGIGLTDDLWWPTVENVAVLVMRAVDLILGSPAFSDAGLWCRTVRIQETATNAVTVHGRRSRKGVAG